MVVDENEFFRRATLRICGNLDFEFALQDCLVYLREFMPADCFQLTLYDQGLGVLRTIAIVTPEDARRMLEALTQKEKEQLAQMFKMKGSGKADVDKDW